MSATVERPTCRLPVTVQGFGLGASHLDTSSGPDGQLPSSQSKLKYLRFSPPAEMETKHESGQDAAWVLSLSLVVTWEATCY
jgi:hypothetical protein